MRVVCLSFCCGVVCVVVVLCGLCQMCVCVCVCSIRTKVQVKQKWTNTESWRSNMRTQRDSFPFSLFFPTHVDSELNKHRDLMCTNRVPWAGVNFLRRVIVNSIYHLAGGWCDVISVCFSKDKHGTSILSVR